MPPPTGAEKPKGGARPPWKKPHKIETIKTDNKAASGSMSGGFVARMRLKQQKDEMEAKLAEAEAKKAADHIASSKSTNFFALTKIKKHTTMLAKKQTIKRTSEYEKGHPWVCNLCNKENRALMMACNCCGRPKRYFVKRSRPAHGKRFAESMRSLQSNYIFKDAHDDVNVMDDGKWTPLHNAAVAANPGLIESLLNNGAVIEAKTLAGFRPLHLACRSRSLQCVEALIHFGAKVQCKTGKSKLTPLHIAAEHGHPGIVKMLIDNGAQVEQLDSGKKTALHYAAENGHVDSAIVIMNHGGQLLRKDVDGWSAKQLAEFFNHRNFVEYIFRLENPGIAMGRIDEFPPEEWHNETYFQVKSDCEGRRKRLQDMLQVNAEVQEMLRLYKGGESFLKSSFHADKSRDLTEEEEELRRDAQEQARINAQL
ncbi:hypothetical protein TL16_g02625 [Triparma laevis f. inornata]|uniref:RanBP2-type domain-containing protein n=2 Tax=Triparma laevis TaxID=1534972 RepID=A0A9W6Z7K7_9STRA|nr:hypothetical protein TrLO_g14406 [Triparma laevis f. longispina]GMH58511.1 hypothetical protein TL16_g02625 [Triparma laevis f. inornata]